MSDQSLKEAQRVYENLRHLEETYRTISKTDHFAVFFEFSEFTRNTMHLEKETDVIVYTLGMARKKLPELVFLIGPDKYSTPMSAADAAMLATDILKMLDEKAAVQLAGDFYRSRSEDGDDDLSLMVSTKGRARIYTESYNSGSGPDLLEKNLIKEKHLSNLRSHYGEEFFDLVILKHEHWVS